MSSSPSYSRAHPTRSAWCNACGAITATVMSQPTFLAFQRAFETRGICLPFPGGESILSSILQLMEVSYGKDQQSRACRSRLPRPADIHQVLHREPGYGTGAIQPGPADGLLLLWGAAPRHRRD